MGAVPPTATLRTLYGVVTRTHLSQLSVYSIYIPIYPHTQRLRRIIFSSVACPAPPYFSTSHKGRDFRVEIIKHKICVLIFSAKFVLNISHSRKNRATYDKNMDIALHVMYTLFL